MVWSPEFRRLAREGWGSDVYVVGHPLVDDFLEFARGRARPNTVRAYAHDLKTFFAVVGKEPAEVRAADVMAFVKDQRRARGGVANVVRISDGSAGLSSATIRRRLAAVSALYGYLVARGDVGVDTNPVPRGLPTRRRRRDGRGQPLVRSVRRLPRVLEPEEVTALMAALRTQRDRAMVQAMLLGGLRRCEVLGLRLQDLHLGEWRVFVAEGKGGHQRLVPVSPSFFGAVASYMDTERPPGVATDRVFVVLKGRRRGEPLSAEGLDEIISGARARAGLEHGTCHELRHTCFTRLREAGMSIEAVQLLAGHRSIASTQLYLHLGDGWLAEEYRRAAEAIEAQATVGMPSSPAPRPNPSRRPAPRLSLTTGTGPRSLAGRRGWR
jgi:integrase/recombinase XerD